MDWTNPQKTKNVFVIFLILAILFLISSGILGYLYWQKNNNYKELKSQKQNLETELSNLKNDLNKNKSVSTKESASLTSENEKLTKENKVLKDQIAADTDQKANALTYTAVLSYLADIVEKHNGLEGWTVEEYQEARKLAEATGNTDYVHMIDWAWNTKDVSQITRLVKFLRDSITGVNNNLK